MMTNAVTKYLIVVLVWIAVGYSAPSYSQPGSKIPPTILLSYPAKVLPEARQKLEAQYGESRWPDGCTTMAGECPAREGALDDLIVKTVYYVSEVFGVLVGHLGEGAVIIQPGTIGLDGNGELQYSIPHPELSAPFRMDFAAAVHPLLAGSVPSYASTNGRYLMPAYIVTTDPSVAGRNDGLFKASSGMVFWIGQANSQPSALLSLRKSAIIEKKAKKAMDKAFAPFAIKPLWKPFDEKAWDAHLLSADGSVKIATPLIERDLGAVLAAIKMTDVNVLRTAQIDAYAKLYAKELRGKEYLASELMPIFIDAERSYLQVAVMRELHSLKSGQFGQSLRERLAAERKLHKDAGTAMWMSALTMTAANLGQGVLASPSNMFVLMGQESRLQSSAEAANAAFGGVSSEQIDVSFQIAGRNETVQVNSLEQLRGQFRKVIEAQPVP